MAVEAQRAIDEGDHQLVETIRRGDLRGAVEMAAHRYGDPLGRACMALLGSQSEAEEAVQETLLSAHDAFGSYRGEGSVRAFLFAIARRKCAQRLAKRARHRAGLRLIHDAEAGAEPPDEKAERRRRAARLRRALEQLKPTEREAVVLRYHSGLSYREVAVAMGIEEAAARKRVSRALSRLRQVLSEEI